MLTLPLLYLLVGLAIAVVWLVAIEDKPVNEWGENEMMTLGIMSLFWPVVIPVAALLWAARLLRR